MLYMEETDRTIGNVIIRLIGEGRRQIEKRG
jgi:hypothetical protein